MNEHGRNDRDILRYTDVEYTPEGYENVYRWDDFLEIAGGDARYAAMLINRTAAGEPEEGLHPETLVDQDIRDAEDTFMSPIYAAEDAARDVTPLTPWEDEDGVAFLSRTLDAGAGAVVPCLWYCRRDEGQGFEVGGVKLDCSNIGFDEVAAAAASNGLDSVLAYLEDSPRGLEPLCDIAVRRADGGQADAVKHFGNQGEAMAMLSAITGCRIQAYGTDTLIYRASLGSSAAAKLAAGALAMKNRPSGRGDAVEIGRRL